MDAALDSLAKFWGEWRKDYPSAAEAFLAFRAHNPEGAAAVRRHCRMLVTHFNSVARLIIAGLISRRTAKILITFPGLNIYYDVAGADRQAGKPASGVLRLYCDPQAHPFAVW